jgi:hypothetical protein
MSQLLIIDVQKTFKASKEVVSPLLRAIPNYTEVIHLYDVISGDGEDPYDLWDEFVEDKDAIYQNFTILTKEFVFFRGFMDQGFDDSRIIELGKLMIKYSITDGRDIETNENKEEFDQLFKKHSVNPNFEDYTFYIPHELVDNLTSHVKSGVTIAGGGFDECLKEIGLLLSILDIDFTILSSCTY